MGKGAFGAVFRGTIVHQRSGDKIDVAIKMLQPVHPGAKTGASLLQQYQVRFVVKENNVKDLTDIRGYVSLF